MRTGLGRSAGLAGSTFVLGVTFGALARAHGWGLGAPVVASLAIFSGSAQFALLAVLAGGGAAWTAVASGALINLRFFPMALSAAPALRGGRIQRAFEAQAVVDGSWVLAHQGEGLFNRGVLFGSALAQWPAWVTGTILGVVLAPSTRLLDATGLDVVFPAFFALLLFDELRHAAPRESRRPAAPSSPPCCSSRCPQAPHSSAAPLPRSSASDAQKPSARANDLDLRRANRPRELRDQGHRPRDTRQPTYPRARQRGHRTPRPRAPRRPCHLRHPRPQLVRRRRSTRPRRPTAAVARVAGLATPACIIAAVLVTAVARAAL